MKPVVFTPRSFEVSESTLIYSRWVFIFQFMAHKNVTRGVVVGEIAESFYLPPTYALLKVFSYLKFFTVDVHHVHPKPLMLIKTVT